MACGSQLLFLWVYIHHQERTLWAGFFSVWKYVDFGVDLSVKCPTAVVGDWKQESVASSKHTWDVQGALGVWLVLWLDTGLFISLVWMSRTLWTAPVVPDTLLGHPNHQMTQLCHQTSGTIQLSSQHLSLTEKSNLSVTVLCIDSGVSGIQYHLTWPQASWIFLAPSVAPNKYGSPINLLGSPSPHGPRHR